MFNYRLTTAAKYTSTEYPTNVSVAQEYEYASIAAECTHTTSNDLFAQFLMDHVLRIKDSVGGEAVYTTFAESYAPVVTDTRIVVPPEFNLENGEKKRAYLAGTMFLFTFKNDSGINFNAAVIADSVLNADRDEINSIRMELREKEPLMQSVRDTNGTSYIFKSGVKVSDLDSILEQWKNNGDENDVPIGYKKYNSIAASNVSTSVVSIETLENSNNFLPSEENIRYTIETTSAGQEYETEYYQSVYLILGAFNKETDSVTSADGLVDCRPYITVMRLPAYYETKTAPGSTDLSFLESGSDGVSLTIPFHGSVLEELCQMEDVEINDDREIYVLTKLINN